MKERLRYLDGYEQVNPMSELRGVQINFEQAHEIRKQMFGSFFPQVTTHVKPPQEFPNENDSLQYRMFGGTKTRLDPNIQSVFDESVFLGGIIRQKQRQLETYRYAQTNASHGNAR